MTRWCACVKICVLNCTPVIVNNWSHTRTCDIMYDIICAAVVYRLVYKPGQKQPPPCFRLNPCFFLSSGLCRLIPRRLEKQVQQRLSRFTGRSSQLTYTRAMAINTRVTWRTHSRVGVGQLVTGPLGFLNSGQLSAQKANEQLLVVFPSFFLPTCTLVGKSEG